MPKRDTPSDLDEYLPDKAAAAAIMEEPDESNDVDPELIEKLQRLKTNPDIMRVAPQSEAAVYIEAAELPAAGDAEKTLPRDEPKVRLRLPKGPTEMPTMPSLRRLQGEPEVPGVVNGPSAFAPSEADASAHGRPFSVRTATLAVLAVLVPVLLVIIVMGRVMRHEERKGEAAPPAPSESIPPNVQAPPATSTPPLSASTPPLSASSAPAASSTNPSALPTTSAPAPIPTGAAQRHRRENVDYDPYEPAPPRIVPAPTPAATPAAPTATSSAPTAASSAPTAASSAPTAASIATAAAVVPKPQPTVSQPDSSPLMHRKPE